MHAPSAVVEVPLGGEAPERLAEVYGHNPASAARGDTFARGYSLDGAGGEIGAAWYGLKMDSETLAAFAAIALFAIGAAVAFFFSPARRLRRRLQRTPVAPIASLEPGAIVRVEGEVALVGDGLRSPVYQQACAYFTVDVRVREYSNANQGQSWYVARTLERRCDFAVRDASGLVHVESRAARFLVETASLVPGDRGEFEPPPHLVELLRAYGHPLTNEHGRPRTFGFDEGVLAAGARVDVLGTVFCRPDGQRVLGGAELVVRSVAA